MVITKDALINEMEAVVDKYVKAYKTDFEYDKESIEEWTEPWWGVWQVRDLGTNLTRFTNRVESIEAVESVFLNMTVLKMYMIEHSKSGWTIKETSLEEVRKRYRGMDLYRIEIYAAESKGMLMRDLTGAFDTEEAAYHMAKKIMEDSQGRDYSVQRVN